MSHDKIVKLALIVCFIIVLALVVSMKPTTVKAVSDHFETPPANQATLNYEDEMMDSDLWWLARGMQEEDGIDWDSKDILKIGTVIMNRVASEYFPNSVKEVLLEEGQYAPFFGEYELKKPDDVYIHLAQILMDGYRSWDDPAIVWQACFVQGEEVVDSVYDPYLGSTTYFCK